jgi:hypothetical protein
MSEGNPTKNSKLGTCRSCGGTVSKNAKACPHCGDKKPVKKEVSKLVSYSLITIMVIMGIQMVIAGPSSTTSSSPPSSSGSVNLSDPAKQAAWIDVSEAGVRTKLKDPASAKFKDSFFMVWKDTPIVCGRVNSKNSFGGYGGFQRFVAAGKDIVYLEEEVADFHNVWREMCSQPKK